MSDHTLCPNCHGSGLLAIVAEPGFIQSYAVYRPQYKPRSRQRNLRLVKVNGARAYRRKVTK